MHNFAFFNIELDQPFICPFYQTVQVTTLKHQTIISLLNNAPNLCIVRKHSNVAADPYSRWNF